MSLVIRHRRGLFGWWAPFFKTEITDEGIVITRFLRSSRFLPWSEIQCLDLSGLRKADVSWITDESLRRLMIKAKRTRFVLFMVPNSRLYADGTLKNWYAASNVFGLTNILPDDADKFREELERQAQKHSINLDTIVLDD